MLFQVRSLQVVALSELSSGSALTEALFLLGYFPDHGSVVVVMKV